MKYVFLGMTAIAVASAAAPAAAQYYPNHNQNHQGQGYNYANPNAGNSMSWRIGQLQTRLQEGVQNRSITRREAGPIRQNIQQLMYLERQYGMNGLTAHEAADLRQRIQMVRQQLHRADDGARGRYAQWDRDDRNDWGAGYNGRVDANNDGWDDRDYNRDGRLDERDSNRDARWNDNGYQGYQGYQQQPAPRSGIAGIIASVLGGGGGLQVGQRVPSNLYGVPHQYQAQYRDGNGVYYRSDGRNIYQVDARSQTVLRIFRI